jgi:hypothetical protein
MFQEMPLFFVKVNGIILKIWLFKAIKQKSSIQEIHRVVLNMLLNFFFKLKIINIFYKNTNFILLFILVKIEKIIYLVVTMYEIYI